jgi:hypothetical protein
MDALQQLLEVYLQLTYGRQDLAEREEVRVLAQHDLGTGAIHANNRYTAFLEEHPHLLASALLQELGHMALRHGELYAYAGLQLLAGIPMTSPCPPHCLAALGPRRRPAQACCQGGPDR